MNNIIQIKGKKINIQGQIPVNIIAQDDTTFMADCPQLDIFSYGDTIDEAIECFDEVLGMFLEDIISRNVAVEILSQCGWKIIEDNTEINIIPPFVIKTIKTSLFSTQKNIKEYA